MCRVLYLQLKCLRAVANVAEEQDFMFYLINTELFVARMVPV